MSSRVAPVYTKLRGNEDNVADAGRPPNIPLESLEKPRVHVSDFGLSALPPKYAPVQSNGDEGEAAPRLQPMRTGWDPPFMRRPVLLAFAVLFLSFFVSLQVIWSWSQAHQGIVTSETSKHYLWTFGPTAVLVLVTVGWRQVDYAAKYIQPWAEMAQRPTSAEQSLLLDYVTPFQAVALVRALRNRHFVVASTITVFSLLKALTIVSTALFSLDLVNRTHTDMVMQLSSSFTGKGYNHAGSVDSRAAYVVYGVQSLNLTYPLGTTAEYAIQLFTPQDQFLDGFVSHTAVVDVFSANMECEIARGASDPLFYNLTFTTSDCIVGANYDRLTNPGYYGLMAYTNCTNLANDNPTGQRLLFMLAYGGLNSQGLPAVLNLSAVVCKPSYAVQSAAVTLGVSNDVQNIHLTDQPSRQLSEVSSFDIAQGVIHTASAANLAYSLATPEDVTFDTFFILMSGSTKDFRTHDLLSPEVLDSACKSTFTKLAAQVASRYLTTNNANTSTTGAALGSISQVEHRLLARPIPLRCMQGIAIVLFWLVLFMLFAVRKGVVPRAPDSLAAIAAMMVRSASVTRQLSDSGYMDMDRIRGLLSGQYFSTVLGSSGGVSSFFVQAKPSPAQLAEVDLLKEPNTTSMNWMRPFSLGYAGKSLAVLGPMAIIIALEVSLRLSNSSSGLADVDGDSSLRYAWLYVPTLVLVLLGTLFNVIDFDIEFLEPYHELSMGYTDADSSLFKSHLGKVPIMTTWDAFWNQKFALLAASISILLAPTLTIISSGLFTVESVLTVLPLRDVHIVDYFNTTGVSRDDNAGVVASMILHGNLSYPAWTYSELAFPQVALSSHSALEGMRSGKATVKSPALRGNMNCLILPEDRVTFRASDQNGTLLIESSMPNGCDQALFSDTALGVPTTGYAGLAWDVFDTDPVDFCPKLGLVFTQTINDKVVAFTVLECTPFIERVEVEATFDVPSLSLSAAPRILADTASQFSSWYQMVEAMDWQTINVGLPSENLDDFFTAVVWGKDGIPASELTNATRLVNAVNHVYGQYVAQELNLGFRSTIPDLPKNQTDIPDKLQGAYTNPNRTRLVQSNLATRFLQGVLGVMLLCAIAIFFLIDMRKVLPKQLGSIAAMVSLLAGSRLLDEKEGLIPPAAEWWSDTEWKKRGVWKGEEFRMGWWDGETGKGVDGREFRIDIRPRDGKV